MSLDYQDKSVNELAAQWALHSEETSLQVLSTLAEKDVEIQRLTKENNKLKKAQGDHTLVKAIASLIENSWGWIFLILLVFGAPIFTLIDRATSCPASPPPVHQIK